jgi:predicted RNase H-like HicB family nuclease
MMKYPVEFGKTATGFSAHVLDLPGCVAAGKSLKQTRKLIAEAMELHLSSMREDGDLIPEPSYVEMVKVASTPAS